MAVAPAHLESVTQLSALMFKGEEWVQLPSVTSSPTTPSKSVSLPKEFITSAKDVNFYKRKLFSSSYF